MKFPLFFINVALAIATAATTGTKKNIISVILPKRKIDIDVVPNQETFYKKYCDDATRLLNNKIHRLSPSGGHHSVLFDQGFQKDCW